MSGLEAALSAEQRRIRTEQHVLAARAEHVRLCLTLARQGVAEGIVSAMLADKGIAVGALVAAGSVA